jgi:aspartyl/asparaginyl beta-hydroxylase (cupin superfamily)
MFLDPDAFHFGPPLEAAFATIRAELDALDVAEFMPWPEYGAYQGTWLTFPFFLRSYPVSVEGRVDLDRNRRRCPRTAQLLRELGSYTAAFSRMEPGCHIARHTDLKAADELRCHLGLRVPPGAVVRVGDEFATWREGKCLLFDGLLEHETANLGQLPRTILMADFHVAQPWPARPDPDLQRVPPP